RRRGPEPGWASGPAPRRQRGRPPALTAFATRIAASILRAHGARNSYDDPVREKLRAEGGQRLEVVFDGDGERVVTRIARDDRAADPGGGWRLTSRGVGGRVAGARADIDQTRV